MPPTAASTATPAEGRDAADEEEAEVEVSDGAGALLERMFLPDRRGRNAIIDDRASVSYGRLVERSARLGAGLLRAGITAGDRVFLCLLDTMDWPMAYLGTLLVGGVPVCADTRLGAADYETMLRESGSRLLIVSRSLYPAFDGLLQRVDSLARVVISEAPLADGGDMTVLLMPDPIREPTPRPETEAACLLSDGPRTLAWFDAVSAAPEKIEAARAEAARAETARFEAARAEAERIEAERIEAERIKTERIKTERVAAEQGSKAASGVVGVGTPQPDSLTQPLPVSDSERAGRSALPVERAEAAAGSKGANKDVDARPLAPSAAGSADAAVAAAREAAAIGAASAEAAAGILALQSAFRIEPGDRCVSTGRLCDPDLLELMLLPALSAGASLVLIAEEHGPRAIRSRLKGRRPEHLEGKSPTLLFTRLPELQQLLAEDGLPAVAGLSWRAIVLVDDQADVDGVIEAVNQQTGLPVLRARPVRVEPEPAQQSDPALDPEPTTAAVAIPETPPETSSGPDVDEGRGSVAPDSPMR